MKKNKGGSVCLILDLIALLVIIISLNSFIYAATFAILAIIGGFITIVYDLDDKLTLAGYGLLIGIILLVIALLPLIFSINRLFLLFW